MRYCKGYIGSTCVSGGCPKAQEDEDGRSLITRCDQCWYYLGCEDCAAPYYGCCPKGKTEEGGEKNE